MNYNQSTEGDKPMRNYITIGINENVFAKSVVYVEGDKNGSIWKAFDITFSNGEEELRSRFFEFKYRPEGKDYEGNLLSQEKQEEDYLKRIKHIFGKVVGSDKEYDNIISSIKPDKSGEVSFERFIDTLNSMCNDTNKFRLKCVNNGKNYPKIQDWVTWGFCESMSVTPSKLRWDEAKHGRKKLDKTDVGTEQVKAEVDGLPF